MEVLPVGPVLGKEAVPSLVDSVGYFLPSIEKFLQSDYKLVEVERELSAQIERALSSGLNISYVDPHMGMAVATPELRAITEKLARKYKLGISTYFGEEYISMWGVPVKTKKEVFLAHLDSLRTDKVNLIEIHIARNNPEMEALVDLNSDLMNSKSKEPEASQHRQREFEMLMSKDFQQSINKKFTLITYKDLIGAKGLETMKAPASTD